MFKLSSNPRFTHEVKVQVPVNGGHSEQSFQATFKVLPLDQIEDEAARTEEELQVTTLKKVVIGIDGLVDDNEQPISYSEEVRDQLIGIPYVRIALMQTYIKAITKVKPGSQTARLAHPVPG